MAEDLAKYAMKKASGDEVARAVGFAYAGAPKIALAVAKKIQPGDYSREDKIFGALGDGVTYGGAAGAGVGFAIGGPPGAMAGAAIAAPVAGALNMARVAMQDNRK